MPTHARSRSALTAVALGAVLLPLGWSLATADAAGGGLSVTPGLIEKTASVGDLSSMTIVNTSARPLRVTVTPRPWAQARSGAVAADRAHTLLSRVGVSVRSFGLPAGGRRTVSLRMTSVPGSGSLYGGIETVGLPPKSGGNGINVGYRIISSLRLDAPASRRRYAVRTSALGVGRGSILLPVRSTGNTIQPLAGEVRIRGAAGTRSGTVRSTQVLPGKVVDVNLGTTRGIPRGTYSVSVTLKQAGHQVLKTTRRLRIG